MSAAVTPLAECRDIVLNNTKEEPLYQQLYQAIQARILSKRLIAGMRLPASRVLAKELNISRNTVQQALAQLQAEGYLESRTGSGVFISARIPDHYHQAKAPATKRAIPTIADLPSRLSYFAQHILECHDPGPISDGLFSPGMPDLKMFPRQQWLTLWHKHLRNNPSTTNAIHPPSGLQPLKQALCEYLGYARAVTCDPDQLIITQGAAQALDLVSRALINPGDRAIIEEPGYLGMRRILQGLGANLIPCPVDEEGLKVDKLPTRTRPSIQLLYTTPTHQYPLGGIMPISRRLELLEWAKEHKTYIIEDDYDSEFQYAARPLPALYHLDQDNRVMYIGSFSKVLSPFLRLGYLVIPKPFAPLLTKIKRITTGITEPVKQAVMAEFIQAGHFGRHLKRMRLAYAEKMQWAVADAEKKLNHWVKIAAQGAGMHLVLIFKDDLNDQTFVERLKKRKIVCKSLSSYYLSSPKKQGLILGLAHMQRKEILHGISIIRQCFLDTA